MTNNTTNLLHHIKLKHGDMPVVQELIKSKINSKKAPLALSTTSVVYEIPVRVPSSIAVKTTAGSIEAINKNIYCWIVATGTPFLKSQYPSFRRIFLKQYPAYTSLRRETFNEMMDADNNRFVECVKGMIHECKVWYLGMPFINVQHGMFNGTDGNNYLGASFSIIHNFDLHIVDLKLTLKNVTNNSNYNANVLDTELNAVYGFVFAASYCTVVSDTTNSATAVAEFFSSEADQVNCEMHQVYSCMKYGYGVLQNTRSSIVSDANGQKLKLLTGKFKSSTESVIPGGPFPEGNELVKNLTAIATYFDHPQRLERLKKDQNHHHVPVGSASRPDTTRVSSVHKLLTQSLYFYWGLKCFFDEKSAPDAWHSKEDDIFLKLFRAVIDDEWIALQEIEAMSASLKKYSLFEAQTSRVMAPWIQYIRK
jgi:hypothetical protein